MTHAPTAATTPDDPEALRLFAIPYACSLASHVVLREARLPHVVAWVSFPNPRLADGSDFRSVNPKGKVAALRLPDGTLLTENIAILNYLAELAGDGVLAPGREGGVARARHFEWLSFVATEIHKQVLRHAFDPEAPAVTKHDAVSRLLPPVLEHVDAHLATRAFLVGDGFTVADAYLLWALVLIPRLRVDLAAAYPSLHAYRGRMVARPAVAAVLGIEGQALAAARAAGTINVLADSLGSAGRP